MLHVLIYIVWPSQIEYILLKFIEAKHKNKNTGHI